jgi:hypothetical protein
MATDNSSRYFAAQRIAYWLSLSMLPSFAVISVCMLMFMKPEAPRIYEMPVILVGVDGRTAALWNGEDHANIRANITKVAGEIANSILANPREPSMTAAKVQRGSTYFLAKSPGERLYLSSGSAAVEKSKTVETTFKSGIVDVEYDGKGGDWSAIVKGVQVTTLENGTQEGVNITLELLFKRADGNDRNEKGRPVLAYNMRLTNEK